jgi:hypothetical protein
MLLPSITSSNNVGAITTSEIASRLENGLIRGAENGAQSYLNDLGPESVWVTQGHPGK